MVGKRQTYHVIQVTRPVSSQLKVVSSSNIINDDVIQAAKDDGLVEIPLESYAPVNAQKIRVNQETADIESCQPINTTEMQQNEDVEAENQQPQGFENVEVEFEDLKKAHSSGTKERMRCCFKTNEQMILTICAIVAIFVIIIVATVGIVKPGSSLKHSTPLPRVIASTVHANRPSTFETTPQSFVEETKNVTDNEIASAASPHMYTNVTSQLKQVKNAKT